MWFAGIVSKGATMIDYVLIYLIISNLLLIYGYSIDHAMAELGDTLLGSFDQNVYILTVLTEGYSEPCQTSKMERFAKIVNG